MLQNGAILSVPEVVCLKVTSMNIYYSLSVRCNMKVITNFPLADITYDELSSSYKEMTIIDVRNRNEIQTCGQIPGSHCIPGETEATGDKKFLTDKESV